MRSLYLLSLLLMPLSAVDSVVTFNEIHYNPSTQSGDDEWIELHNQMAINVDLSGWKIMEGVDFTFPEGTTIPGSGYLVIAKNPAAGELGPFQKSLSNSGETLTLLSRSDRLMDEMDYRDSGEWPIAADGSGATLAKLTPEALSGKSASWRASSFIGGTRGAANQFSDSTGLVINEITAAESGDFFIEIYNPTGTTISTADYEVVIDGPVPEVRQISSPTLSTWEFSTAGNFAADEGLPENTKVYLRRSGGTEIVDARRVTGRLRGRTPDGDWLFPNQRTPLAENVFNFSTNIVINEICYNAPILNPDPGSPPTFETITAIPSNATWRFNESGASLPSDWAGVAHPVGGNWESGPATIAFDWNLGLPIATSLTNPINNFPSVVTHYFETDFELTADAAGRLAQLELTHLIDDGAVFYLNGVEIYRFNMPEGDITSSTFALAPGISNATFSSPIPVNIPTGLPVTGTNRISVELHQVSLGSNDVVFNLSASTKLVTSPGTPAKPLRKGTEQWIELFNRGDSPVNLIGWEFTEGIDFTFDQSTILNSGDYLVIGKDPDALAEKYPDIRILGPYSGSLSRSGETLVLKDASRNPADSLRYFDGGKWPSKADAGGSTLELRDPDADNALPNAWAASSELSRTSWNTYSYRGIAQASAVGPDNQWRELILGLLEEGEILIDDLSVIEDPGGAARQFIANGDFETGTLAPWRPLGNHEDATIIPDPDDPGNSVLHLCASGSTEHMHNHLETTFQNNETIINGTDYEVSFRARWLSGNHLLHSRLYFNRLPAKTILHRPNQFGTPGTPNSTLAANIGPTSQNLTHSPAVPSVGEFPVIHINLSDPDGTSSAELFHRTNGGDFSSVPMTQLTSTLWRAILPSGAAGDVIQFYVVATDGLGATSSTPAGGPDSRALLEIQDNRAATTACINNIRFIMDPADHARMFTPRNLMSNGRYPCTVIDEENRIYYDAGVRIKGSQRARTKNLRIGFNLGFPSDNLYRNVHKSVAIDRSEGQSPGLRELLFDLTATSTGGIPGEHNDICYIIAPDPNRSGPAILQMARFGGDFLDDQFENGGDGTVYEYELIYYPTSTDAGGYKLPQPDLVLGTDILDQGSNPEDYRWNYLIKKNQQFDNFDPILRLTELFSLPTAEFNEAVNEVLDVDQWLRAIAYSAVAGAGDSFFSNSNHNGQFYGRPDGKLLYFPHDLDFQFQTTRDIFQNTELKKIINNPAHRRTYLAHLYDICSTVYNRDWMTPWTTHFDECVPGPSVFLNDLNYVDGRSTYILNQLNSQVSPTTFQITTNGGNDFSTDDSPVTLSGEGWLDIWNIRLTGNDEPLELTWSDSNSFSTTLALPPGPTTISLEAYDRIGNLVGSDTITITQTDQPNLPSSDTLVISEVYYNPPGGDESTEFIELQNVHATATLDLSGIILSDGVSFTFPSGTELPSGSRLLVVADETSFENNFGPGLPVAGSYDRNLSNSSDTITLGYADGTVIQSFTYDQNAPWPTEADGNGFSLVLAQTTGDPALPASWQASLLPGGTPGNADSITLTSWKASLGNPANNSDNDSDSWNALQEFYLGGTPGFTDNLEPIFNFNIESQTLIASITRRAGIQASISLMSSDDLLTWAPVENAVLTANRRLPGRTPLTDELTFSAPLTAGMKYYRFEFLTE